MWQRNAALEHCEWLNPTLIFTALLLSLNFMVLTDHCEGLEAELQIETPLCAIKSPFKIHGRRESCKPRHAQGWQIAKPAIYNCIKTLMNTSQDYSNNNSRVPSLVWHWLCCGVTSNKPHSSRLVLLVTRWHVCPMSHTLCRNSRHFTERHLHSPTSLDLTKGQGQHMLTSAS